MKKLDALAGILVLVGGLNWGLVASPSSTSSRGFAADWTSARRTP